MRCHVTSEFSDVERWEAARDMEEELLYIFLVSLTNGISLPFPVKGSGETENFEERTQQAEIAHAVIERMASLPNVNPWERFTCSS